MSLLRVNYLSSLPKMILSAVLGAWFHILLDAPIYLDIKPFYPLDANPLYGVIAPGLVYIICAVSFIPAIIMYFIEVLYYRKQKEKQV